MSAEDFMDDGTPIRLAVTIDRSSRSATFDFGGTVGWRPRFYRCAEWGAVGWGGVVYQDQMYTAVIPLTISPPSGRDMNHLFLAPDKGRKNNEFLTQSKRKSSRFLLYTVRRRHLYLFLRTPKQK